MLFATNYSETLQVAVCCLVSFAMFQGQRLAHDRWAMPGVRTCHMPVQDACILLSSSHILRQILNVVCNDFSVVVLPRVHHPSMTAMRSKS